MQSADVSILQISQDPTATSFISDDLREAVLREALSGLCKPAGAQKTLSPWLFYDERGSQLFEQITDLPEYYLTRTERSIFEKYVPELPLYLVSPVTIAELGAGSASKTGVVLREFLELQDELLYQPIDISSSALDEAATSLQLPGLRIESLVANYITEPYAIRRLAHHRVMALYIGSSIGNFSPEEARGILRTLRNHLQEDDSLLLGVDLAPTEGFSPGKSVNRLRAAYDDAAGVTAAFNKNVLTRLNRELGADFNLDGFAHRARWNAEESRIEMHLESLLAQTAHIYGKRIDFARGETIHTENSYKFTDESLAELLADSGFRVELTFHDPDGLFAVTLAKAN